MNANDEIPQVPDDAPPAILFQLSYRANEDHRNGYRPGDTPERIVTPPTSGEAVEDAAEAGAGRTRAAVATIAMTVAANKARRIEGTLSCRPHGRNLPGYSRPQPSRWSAAWQAIKWIEIHFDLGLVPSTVPDSSLPPCGDRIV